MFVIDWAFSSPLTYRKHGTREEANPWQNDPFF